MRVDVVGAVLRVVLEDEHDGALPERRGGESLDDAPQGEVVVRDERARGRSPGLPARRVVVRQSQERERGHLSRRYEAAKFLEPGVDALLIGNREIPAGETGRRVRREERLGGGPSPGRATDRELTVIAHRDFRALGGVP